MPRFIYHRRIHVASTVLNASKEESAKLQLKYLPNPLKKFPKKKNAYNLYVKARLSQSKEKKISKQLGKEWKVDRNIQKVIDTN